jgi:diaminohydroxyphosphoribosylaminopyrimidine deaminase/5-amino-6-(5-phosphoribosylamino)uracil reductase
MDAIAQQELNQLIDRHQQFLAQSSFNRPWITLSFGMSLDGKIATHTGDSKYISGPETRQFVHELRHRHDGILVGIETVLMDHPLLTTRLPQGVGKQPLRIILDSRLRIPLTETIVSPGTIVVTKTTSDPLKMQALIKQGVVILKDPTQSLSIHLPWLMEKLKAYPLTAILVEGGGTIHESFIRYGFVDIIYAQISPILIGGKDAKTPVEGQGFARLVDASRVAFCNHFQMGSDIIMVATSLSSQKESHA